MDVGSQKLGKFSVDLEIIKDAPDVVREIMGRVIVVRAECIYATKAIEYVAVCDDFEEVEEGTTVPNYDVMYDPDGPTVTWVKEA